MRYNCIIKNGHFLVEVDSKYYLLDTGSPFSCCANNNVDRIKIDNIEYELSYNQFYNFNSMRSYISSDLFGIIGANILCNTSFTIYLENNEYYIEFKPLDNMEGNPIDVYINRNVILCNLRIGDKMCKVLFDTGACINYIKNDDKYKDESKYSLEFLTDKNGRGEQIRSKKLILDAIIKDKPEKICFGLELSNCGPNQTMSHCSCDAIMGLYNIYIDKPIFEEYVVFDYKNNKIYIK